MEKKLSPEEELDDILLTAEDGWFQDKPHHLFSALAAALARRNKTCSSMRNLYDNSRYVRKLSKRKKGKRS